MEILEYLEKMNDALEKSLGFRAFKMILAFYLIIMVIAIILMIYRLATKLGYFVVLQHGQEVPTAKGKMQLRWDETRERIESQNPNEWKAAILESANMLNEVLGIIGYEGALLGEKLEGILPSQLENLEEVKEANRVKNRIVNDEDFVISQLEAQKIVDTFANSLRFLEAIQ
jgi:hypothetical protein